MMTEEKLTFEQALEKLNTTSSRIADPNISLEEALKCYEDGAAYYALCRGILEEAKQRVRLVGDGSDELFEAEDDE